MYRPAHETGSVQYAFNLGQARPIAGQFVFTRLHHLACAKLG